MREFMQIVESHGSTLPATPENIRRAQDFVFRKWIERAKERGSADPSDLSYSCKFTSQFVQRVFGGELRGNYDHQFVVTDGQIIDLNIDAEDVRSLGDRAHEHDAAWFGRDRDHKASMKSCLPRVKQWVAEFMEEVRAGAPARV